HRNRRFGQDAERRNHDLHLARSERALRQEGLVLPGEQYVAQTALYVGHRGAACAGVEHRHVAEQLAHVLEGALWRTARLPERPGPGGQIVPTRAAGGLWIRRDHLYAGLDQIAPVPNVLRISLAHQENDRRSVRCAVVRQARLPVRRQNALRRNRVDVARQRERHHVRRQAVDHGAGLLARAAVRLTYRDVLARLLLPVACEFLVV